jgi:hypothetical protein
MKIYAFHIGYGQGYLVKKMTFSSEKDKLDAMIIPNPGGGIELSLAFQGIASVFSKDFNCMWSKEYSNPIL